MSDGRGTGDDSRLGRSTSAGTSTVQHFQEETYAESWDYRAGSPHLVHRGLYDWLVSEVLGTLRAVRGQGLPPTVLEIGAGHGGYTEPVLAAGGQVTATEMSRPSLVHLQDRFGANSSFRGEFDPDGSLDVLGDQRFSVMLCASVLHHIPDYMMFVRRAVSRHLLEGGSFISIQDPLWYPGVPFLMRTADRVAYLSWRMTQGQYTTGARTLLRRIRGVYDETNPADMVEYHAVRSGVDQDRLRAMLAESFQAVRLGCYWSTPSGVFQRAGTWLGLQNTFMLVAECRFAGGASDTAPIP